ncbi:MAG: hypothetical protein M1833_006362 [Piccolia ochrophora]|nr:MAG: hypothetical protein M1833_006362 [Piccolia ochrophora]
MVAATSSAAPNRPRIIIHGGAGNLTRSNLPPALWASYRESLIAILQNTHDLLTSGASALDAVTAAVVALEDNPLYNASRGAVFTRAGTIELEASVMVSHGYRKRGCGVFLLNHVKHPILLAKEMLVRGDEEGDGGGAYGHVQLSGAQAESLAEKWGLEMVDPAYFWTKRRWEDHLRGLEREKKGSGDPSWDQVEFVPQGTVGAVALDKWGTLCVATSTGGLTNKLPGRLGDTPTLGAGFWAGEWNGEARRAGPEMYRQPQPWWRELVEGLRTLLGRCSPLVNHKAHYDPLSADEKTESHRTRGVALSGTGNGDSFLKLSACHTVGMLARFCPRPQDTLQWAVTRIAGPNGDMQLSAGSRWKKTGEGQAGIIGIDVVRDDRGCFDGKVVADFNCGGLLRAWIDDGGKTKCMVFREEY